MNNMGSQRKAAALGPSGAGRPDARESRWQRFFSRTNPFWLVSLPVLLVLLLGSALSLVVADRAEELAARDRRDVAQQIASLTRAEIESVSAAVQNLSALVNLGPGVTTKANLREYVKESTLDGLPSVTALGVVELVEVDGLDELQERERRAGRERFVLVTDSQGPSDRLILTHLVLADPEIEFPDWGVDLEAVRTTLVSQEVVEVESGVVLQRADAAALIPYLRILGQESLTAALDFDLVFISASRHTEGRPVAWTVVAARSEQLFRRLIGVERVAGIRLEHSLQGSVETIKEFGEPVTRPHHTEVITHGAAEWIVSVEVQEGPASQTPVLILAFTLTLSVLLAATIVLMRRSLEATARSRESARRARIDTLTGLGNRAALEKIAEELRESGRRYALLVGDLDGFKEVNDRCGHAAGDFVLCEASRRLSEVVRDCDTVLRWGGDEFLVVLRRLRVLDDVFRVQDRIRKELAKPLSWKGQTIEISISTGLAFPGEGEPVSSVLERADRVMYSNKLSGGDSRPPLAMVGSMESPA